MVGLSGAIGHVTSGNGQLNLSTRSFKIVTECPLVVMFLFQLYSRLVQTNIPLLLPLMVSAISVPGPEKVPPHLKTQFFELKGAQVKVRMVEDDLMYSTFLEVYENHCARNDREADQPITYFKEQLNQAISGQIPAESVVDLRLQAYNDITKSLVSDSIFSQYMYKTLLSGNHMWAFKKQFAIQLALSSFMSFMLQIGGRSPNKILFAKNTGKIFQIDFHPAYDANGMIEFNEPVPFRLTRNMQAFFSHFGVEGLIVSAMCSAAQTVISPKQSQHIWHQLAMFFRDELRSWSWRRPLGMPLGQVSGVGIMNPVDLKLKITTNVDQVISRINGIAPQFLFEEDENTVDPPQSVQRGVAELVEAALTGRNLCMMDPTWHPWF